MRGLLCALKSRSHISPKRAFSAPNGHGLGLGLGLGKISRSHSRLGEYRPNWVAVALQLPQELPKVKEIEAIVIINKVCW